MSNLKILAIDTSTERVSVAVSDSTGKIYSMNRYKQKGASQAFLFMRALLEKRSIPVSALDAIALGSGPGSFTGLRISFSIVKALTVVCQKPVIARSSFEICASQVPESRKRIAVVSDARRNLIYGAVYRRSDGGLLSDGKVGLFTLKGFVQKNKDCLFLTYDESIKEMLENYRPHLAVHDTFVYPRAKNLIVLAQHYYHQKEFVSLPKLTPLYLYPDDCQVKPIHVF